MIHRRRKEGEENEDDVRAELVLRRRRMRCKTGARQSDLKSVSGGGMSPARFNGVPLTRRPCGGVVWRGRGPRAGSMRRWRRRGRVYRAAAQFWRGRYTADDGPAAVVHTRLSSRVSCALRKYINPSYH